MDKQQAIQNAVDVFDKSVSDIEKLLEAYKRGEGVDPESLKSYKDSYMGETKQSISFLVPRLGFTYERRKTAKDTGQFYPSNRYHPLLKLLSWAATGTKMSCLETTGIDDRYTSEAGAVFWELDDLIEEIRYDAKRHLAGIVRRISEEDGIDEKETRLVLSTEGWRKLCVDPKYKERAIGLAERAIEVGRKYLDLLSSNGGTEK